VVRDGASMILWRLLGGFGGGYLVVSGMIALMGSALPKVGLNRVDAISLGTLLALFVYVPLCMLMFASGKPMRDGLAVFVVASICIAAATAI